MKKREVFLVGLAVWALAQAVPAQDKNLALLNEYSILSGHIEKAKTAFQRNNLTKCEQEVIFCLERLAEHHEAHFLQSQILYKRGEFEKALEHIQAAEEGYLKMTEAAAVLEQEKMKEKMDSVGILIDDAREAAAAEDAANKRGSCAVERYGKAAQDAKDKLSKEERLDETGRGKEISPIPPNYLYFHGNCLFRLKRLPEAEAQYLQAIKADPRCGEAYNNLINLLFMEKRLDEARTYLSQAEAYEAVINPGLKKAVLEKAGK
jgi:tetratricopeptide (TPR) repeat protein